MTTLLAQDSQCNFRVSAFRMNYGVDIKPTESSVSYLYDLLLSEAEQLMYGESLAKPSGVIESPQKPSVKMMATPSKGNGRKCKAWGTPTGCRFGKACKFAHDDLPDKADRCWICSSLYHRKAECPHKGDTTHGAPGGGGESSKDPDGAGNAGSGKAKGKGKEKGKMKEKGSLGQAQQSAEGAQKSDDKETASVKKVETTGEETSAKEIGSLVSEATSLLRSLRLGTDRQVKVCVVKRLQIGEAPLTLLASTSSESVEPWSRCDRPAGIRRGDHEVVQGHWNLIGQRPRSEDHSIGKNGGGRVRGGLDQGRMPSGACVEGMHCSGDGTGLSDDS